MRKTLNSTASKVLLLQEEIHRELVHIITGVGKLCGQKELELIDTSVYNWPYLHNNHNLLDSTITYSTLKNGVEYFFSYTCPYEGGVDEFSFKVYDRWLDMESYEDILKDIISLSKNKRGKEKEQKLLQLQRLCKELGYSYQKDEA